MFSFKVREESHLDEQIFHSLTQVMTVCYIESWQVIFRLIWEGEWLLDSSIHSVTQHIKHHHLFRPAPFDAENTRSLSAGFYLIHKVRHPEPLSVGSTGLFKHLPSPLSEWKKKANFHCLMGEIWRKSPPGMYKRLKMVGNSLPIFSGIRPIYEAATVLPYFFGKTGV